jgi:two-component system, OmpR family, phosphate regulon sensor histidine kinase PhoR
VDPLPPVEDITTSDFLRAVIEQAAEGIWIADAQGRVLVANAVARDLVGIGRDEHPPLRELLRRARLRTIDGKIVETGQGPTSRALRGETVHGEYAFAHARTGDDIMVRIASTPVRDATGKIRGAVVLTHDVSDVRRMEREKDEFLSLVTHELKTPLTPLKSVAQLMRMRLRRARSGERELDLDSLERNLATIERQVDRMDRLVTDLLEVSRVGRGRFELVPAPMDLAAVVREVVQRWSDATQEEGRHRFELVTPARVDLVADQQRVEQVVANLIGNAVKYSPHGGTVRVQLEERPGVAVVIVRDEGIGITAEELPTLGSEPFVRGHRTHGYAGVGVGLYLSRLVAEGHGGRVELESDGEDKGTTARLILPR